MHTSKRYVHQEIANMNGDVKQQSKYSSNSPEDRMPLTLFLIKRIIIQSLPSTAPYKF